MLLFKTKNYHKSWNFCFVNIVFLQESWIFIMLELLFKSSIPLCELTMYFWKFYACFLAIRIIVFFLICFLRFQLICIYFHWTDLKLTSNRMSPYFRPNYLYKSQLWNNKELKNIFFSILSTFIDLKGCRHIKYSKRLYWKPFCLASELARSYHYVFKYS